MAQLVEPYVSDDEEEREEVEVPRNRAARRNHVWVIEKVFDISNDPEEALDAAVKHVSEEGFAFHYSNKTLLCKNDHYRCKEVKRRGPQCSAARRLQMNHHDTKVHLYKTEADHDHEGSANTVPWPVRIKEEIRTLFYNNADFGYIWETVAQFHCGDDRRKLTNLLATFRKERYGTTTINIGQFMEWCQARTNVPEYDHDAYVLDMETNEEAGNVRVVLSTRHLLQETAKSTVLHADGTYKLIWQGFPVIVVGTTDAERKFILGAIAICPGETSEDYEFVFRAMQTAYVSLGLEQKFK